MARFKLEKNKMIMKYLRLALCFLVILFVLFMLNGIFFAIFVFLKVLKLMVFAAIATGVYYLITRDDPSETPKDDGEGV